MKIDRLIGILSILLQEEKTTAPELAERFEVSRRTKNRDIEDLCMAGIPIRTAQGAGGGISIMDGYRMDSVAESAQNFICRNAPMPDDCFSLRIIRIWKTLSHGLCLLEKKRRLWNRRKFAER